MRKKILLLGSTGSIGRSSLNIIRNYKSKLEIVALSTNKNIRSNKIKVIYLLGQENEILFENIRNYFTDVCFKSKTIVENRFSVHELTVCKK